MDENLQRNILCAGLDWEEEAYSRMLRRRVVFSQKFRNMLISGFTEIDATNDSAAQYHKAKEKITTVETCRILNSLSRNPPPCLECFGEMFCGNANIYIQKPQKVPVCVRLPESNNCRSITLVVTRQYLIETTDLLALWEDEVTEDRVVVQAEYVTADLVVDATSKWIQTFVPRLAMCEIIHLPFEDAALLTLEHLAQFAGHKDLNDMVMQAQRETESR